MEGPTLSPSYTLMGMKYNALLRQYERNGNDNFMGGADWKPSPATKISFEMQANHYKSDTFYTLDPNGFLVQEADGTPAYLGNYTSLTPYGIAGLQHHQHGHRIHQFHGLYAAVACKQARRPTDHQSGLRCGHQLLAHVADAHLDADRDDSSAKHGHQEYCSERQRSLLARHHEYAELLRELQGLNGAIRSAISTGGNGTAHRAVIGGDFGLTWRVTPVWTLADQVSYSSIQEPSHTFIPAPATLSTPGAPNQTINYSGTLTPGTGSLPHGNTGALAYNFFGQSTSPTARLRAGMHRLAPAFHLPTGSPTATSVKALRIPAPSPSWSATRSVETLPLRKTPESLLPRCVPLKIGAERLG